MSISSNLSLLNVYKWGFVQVGFFVQWAFVLVGFCPSGLLSYTQAPRTLEQSVIPYLGHVFTGES